MRSILFCFLIFLTGCYSGPAIYKTGYYVKSLNPSIAYSIGSDVSYPVGVFMDSRDSSLFGVEMYYSRPNKGDAVKLVLRPSGQMAGVHYNWGRRRFMLYKIK